MLLDLLMLWTVLAMEVPTEGARRPFRSVAAAMKVDQPGLRGDLSEEALQYILDSTGLRWSTNWTKFSPHPEVRARVSLDRVYCAAYRGYFGEFGSGSKIECCLIDSSSTVRWRRSIGRTCEHPVVSTQGHVAFLVAGEFNASIEVLMYDSLGDTLISRNLGAYAQRTVVGFSEVFDFSPDGSLFFTTMNSIGKPPGVPNREETMGHDNTILYLFDLAKHKDYAHHLGAFRPREYAFVDAALELRGASGFVRVLDRGSRIEWAGESATEKR